MRITQGLAVIALAGLAACGPQANNAKPAPYAQNNTSPGWPGAQPGRQPAFAPMSANQFQQSPLGPPAQAPQAQGPQGPIGPAPAQPGPYAQGPYQPQPGQPNAQPPYQPANNGPAYQPQRPAGPGGGDLQVPGPPRGMREVASPAGYVFSSNMSGSPQASKLVEALAQAAGGYFDNAPQIISNLTDPTNRMSQAAFQATLRGQPVAGMLAAVTDGQNQGMGFVMFDRSDRVQQTMPVMYQAASSSIAPAPQANRGGNPQNGGNEDDDNN